MRRVLFALFALLVAVATGALWYAAHRGFTSKWRRYVAEEFRKRGVEVTLRRLTLDPMHGIVAKDVRIYDARDQRRILAVVDEMVLQVNFANLARGKTFLDALDLRDANLSLPLDPQKPNGQKIEIGHLNARLFLPPQQIYLAYSEAEVLGLHVNASGRLIHPQAFQLTASSRPELGEGVLAGLLKEIKRVKFEGDPPVVSLTFSGDLAHPDQVFADLAFWAERIQRDRYTLKNLYIGASYRAGVFDLNQLVASDASGELRLTGLWDPASHRAQMQFRSTLDAASLARAWGDYPWLDDFVFYAPPSIAVRLDTTLNDPPQYLVSGELSTEKFAYRSVVFEHAESGFSWDGKQWSLRDAHVTRGNGEEISGDALQVAGDFRARLTSTLDPKALRPLFPERMSETLRQFEFPKPPSVTLQARGLSSDVDALRVDGEASVGPASFRGVPAESAQATLHYENRVLSVAPFQLKRSEGDGSGGLFFDFAHDEIRFDKVRTTFNPPEAAMWVDPNLVHDLLPFHFTRQLPTLLIDGLVHTQGGLTTRLVIDFDAPAGVDYTFLKKDLSFPKLSGKLLFTNDQLQISEISGSLFGGILSGGADISLVPSRPGYKAHLDFAHADFAGLAKVYFEVPDCRGRLDGHYEFTGAGDDMSTMNGNGQVTISQGNVLVAPFLGPLAGILDNTLPGWEREVVQDASAGFKIARGVISTDDLVVQGNGLRALGNGQLSFSDDRMDFDVRLDALGLPGFLLSPVSSLFEFTADQKLSQPRWRLKRLPPL